MTHSGPTQSNEKYIHTIYPRKSAHTNAIVYEIKLPYETETMKGGKCILYVLL